MKLGEGDCCQSASPNLTKNVGCWEDCDNGTYRGTFNGKHWKTRDKRIAEEILNFFGRERIVDVDDILSGKVVYDEYKQTVNPIDTLTSEYDRLLECIEKM